MNSLTSSWESAISLNSGACGPGLSIPPVSSFCNLPAEEFDDLKAMPEVSAAIEKDRYPLPDTHQREGYYGENHLRYWLSGFRDYQHVKSLVTQKSKPFSHLLDFGGSTGRVSRHFACQHPEHRIYISDLNLKSVNWANTYLPKTIFAFQNTSIPHLPLKDNSIDAITAFSVFTHIESFHLQWFLELRRLLKPDGVLYVTLHTDHTLANLSPAWPLSSALNAHSNFDPKMGLERLKRNGRLIYRFNKETSYSSNVFYHRDYFQDVVGRVFDILSYSCEYPGYQDSYLLVPR